MAEGSSRGKWRSISGSKAEPDHPALFAQQSVQHGRFGKQAIARFARENDAVSKCFQERVPPWGRRIAAENAAFHVDAAPVSKKFRWAQSAFLEAFGQENDLLLAGVAQDGVAEVLAVVRDNLEHLNAIRADLFVRSRETSRVKS